MAVLSCYLGGENLILMHNDQENKKINDYPFDLLIFSLGNLPAQKFDIFKLLENKEGIKTRPATRTDFNTGFRFDLFFKKIELFSDKNLIPAEKNALLKQPFFLCTLKIQQMN